MATTNLVHCKQLWKVPLHRCGPFPLSNSTPTVSWYVTKLPVKKLNMVLTASSKTLKRIISSNSLFTFSTLATDYKTKVL